MGLIGEQVSDLTRVAPEQITPAPVHIPEAPFLGDIIQTNKGIIQLIRVERIRETLFDAHLLNERAASNDHPSNAEEIPLSSGDPTPQIENPGSEF